MGQNTSHRTQERSTGYPLEALCTKSKQTQACITAGTIKHNGWRQSLEAQPAWSKISESLDIVKLKRWKDIPNSGCPCTSARLQLDEIPRKPEKGRSITSPPCNKKWMAEVTIGFRYLKAHQWAFPEDIADQDDWLALHPVVQEFMESQCQHPSSQAFPVCWTTLKS